MNTPIKELLYRKLSDSEIHALNSLLDTEILEVEAYNQAIQKVKDIDLIPTLETCRNSHAQRIETLRKRINDLGGTPRESAGLLGSVAQFVESAASMLSDRATIAVLAGSEEFCSQQYESNMQSVDSASWNTVQEDLLPSQEKTEYTLKQLSTSLHDEKESKESSDS